MLTRYWSLSQHGQLQNKIKGLATKYTIEKWPIASYPQQPKQLVTFHITELRFSLFLSISSFSVLK